MDTVVTATEDAGQALRDAETFLATDPIAHNLILTLLRQRARSGEKGRYWIVRRCGAIAGMALQSPLFFSATVTPMGRASATALVDAITGHDIALPGVSGEAGTAAAFAGHWAQRTRQSARVAEA